MTDAASQPPRETQAPSETPAPNALDDDGRKHGPWHGPAPDAAAETGDA